MVEFLVYHYAPDGELLGRAQFNADNLSRRWVAFCDELLVACGPVFAQRLEGALSHFSIEGAGPICRFSVRSNVVYSCILLSMADASRRDSSIAWFVGQLRSSEGFFAPDRIPAFLVLDTLSPETEEHDREPLFELARHYAAAYLCRHGT